MNVYKLFFFAASFFSYSAASNTLTFECPATISVKQELTDTTAVFSADPSSGLHDLVDSDVVYKSDRLFGKASLIFNSVGVRADEEIEDGSVYKEIFIIDPEYYSDKKFRFFCIYRDTAVTLSVPIDPNYKECTVTTKDEAPSTRKLKTIKMECGLSGE